MHQAGCASAKKNGVENAVGQFFRDTVQLTNIGARPSRLVDLSHNVAVEIAIRAFGLAKWPMDIEAKATVLPIFSQNCPRQISGTRQPGG